MRVVYLDNMLVCHIYSDDQKTEAAAFDKVMDAHSDGKVKLVTSQITKDEIDKCPVGWRKKHMQAYRLLEKVQFIPSQDHKGYASQSDPFGGFTAWPIMDDNPIWSRLREIDLDVTDAHHVTLAIENKCDWFLTCDKKSILNKRNEIERAFPQIKLMLPSELVSSGLLDKP